MKLRDKIEKPLTEYLHPVDNYAGLKGKYLVFKADTGEQVENCFILRPDKDAAAVEALRAYAKVTDNDTLAKDIYNWVGNGVTVQDNTEITDELLKQLRNAPLTVLHEEPTIEVVQEWILVKDRLPEMRDDGFADAFLVTDGNLAHIAYFVDGNWIFTDNGQMKEPMFYDVTHWMPLPQPPERETMPELYEYSNICDVCVHAPCVCGNDPENCAIYVKEHCVDITPPKEE